MIKQFKISLIITSVLVLTSFVPILQVILMTINGGFLSLFAKDPSNILIYIINSIGATVFLMFFYFSGSVFLKFFSGISFLFFFFPLASYLLENIIPKDPYYFSLCLAGVFSGSVLVLTDLLKFKIKN